MASKFSRVMVIGLACGLMLTGCKKESAPNPQGSGNEATPQNSSGSSSTEGTPKAGAADAAGPSATANPADAGAKVGEPPKTDTAAAPNAPSAGATAVDKQTLAKAYEEIYCAQKRGETDQILDIYKKYGFTDPKAWTEAWSKASEDVTWFEETTKKVQEACK